MEVSFLYFFYGNFVLKRQNSTKEIHQNAPKKHKKATAQKKITRASMGQNERATKSPFRELQQHNKENIYTSQLVVRYFYPIAHNHVQRATIEGRKNRNPRSNAKFHPFNDHNNVRRSPFKIAYIPFLPDLPNNDQKGQPTHNSAFEGSWINFSLLKELTDAPRHHPTAPKVSDNGIPNLLKHHIV